MAALRYTIIYNIQVNSKCSIHYDKQKKCFLGNIRYVDNYSSRETIVQSVVNYNSFVTSDILPWRQQDNPNIAWDLVKFDKTLKTIRKEMDSDRGEFVFDPDDFKDIASTFEVESYRLPEEGLLEYAKLATKLRR